MLWKRQKFPCLTLKHQVNKSSLPRKPDEEKAKDTALVTRAPAPAPASVPVQSFSESLRLVREASDAMFASVRELKTHLAELQGVLKEAPDGDSDDGGNGSERDPVDVLKEKLSGV